MANNLLQPSKLWTRERQQQEFKKWHMGNYIFDLCHDVEVERSNK